MIAWTSYKKGKNLISWLVLQNQHAIFVGWDLKNYNVAPVGRSRFPVKLICCIAFVSASSACYLLKSTATILLKFLKKL